jgi:hypothetical protein
MLIKELFTEAKFRKPITMYHGTSTNFLRSILKHGMAAKPKQKTWQTDPDASLNVQSRASLTGTYYASNFMTAYSSAGRTVNKFPGERMIVIAQIQPQSAKSDEDNISGYLNSSYNSAFGGNYSDNYRIVSEIYYDYRENYNRVKNKFIDILHGELTKNQKKPVPKNLLSDTFDIITLRIIAYGAVEDKFLFSRIENKPSSVLSTQEAEQSLLDIKEKLTGYYRESTIDTDDWSHTLRITDPVGFSGANKITHIIEIPKTKFDDKHKIIPQKLILYYGDSNTVPEKFITDYKKSIGDFPGFERKVG